MSHPHDNHVTTLLNRAGAGDEAAIDELLPLVYDQLRCEVARRMAAERADHMLQPTALVHEAYLGLVGDRRIPWQNTAHFYAAAAEPSHCPPSRSGSLEFAARILLALDGMVPYGT